MKVLALTGGVGGAKLAGGLYHQLHKQNQQPNRQTISGAALTCLVNTADDFSYLGLNICPDLDSLMYALSDENNLHTGWGRRDETWQMHKALQDFGVEPWFAIGDLDVATHILRTQALRGGESLTEITARLAGALGIDCLLLPMTEDSVATKIHTKTSVLDFQNYFVIQQARPEVQKISFAGISEARPNPGVMKLLTSKLDLIVICPSNPYLSVNPILQLPGLTEALIACSAPVVAVSPLIGGNAIKGPTARIMGNLGVEISAAGVACYYTTTYPGLLSGFVLDQRDVGLTANIESLGLECISCDILMKTPSDKNNLAKTILTTFAVSGDNQSASA